MKKLGGILGRIALVALGLLIPVLVLEMTARWLNLAPPPIPNPTIWDGDPDLGWRHIPNSGGTFYSSYNEYATDVQINSLGLRDDLALTDYNLPDNTFKLLILADSFGEALQVPLEATFYKQLQTQLTQSGRKTQTINAGVGNWGNDQELTYYRLEGYKYKPDLTLLFFYTGNDTNNNYGPLEIARNGGSIQKSFYQLDSNGALTYPQPFNPETAYPSEEAKPKPLPPAPMLKTADWLWLNSALYRWLVPYLRDIPFTLQALGPSGLLGGEGQIRAAHPVVPVPFYVYQSPMSEDWSKAWALTEAILVDLRNEVEADGGRFAVVVIPTREQVYPEKWEATLRANQSMQAKTWDLTLPNKQLAQIAMNNNILMLDLLPVFQGADLPGQGLYFQHDGHWTAAGHRLAAEAVFDFVLQHGLVSP